MADFTIRRTEKCDFEAIAKIERECFSCPWSEKAIEDFCSFDTNLMFIAYCDGNAVGYIGFSIVLDEVDIANVAVDANFRRCGIGKALIERVLDYCKAQAVSTLTLEVRESNRSAISLYAKCGFEKVGIRKNFYTKPSENAIIMAYSIKNTP